MRSSSPYLMTSCWLNNREETAGDCLWPSSALSSSVRLPRFSVELRSWASSLWRWVNHCVSANGQMPSFSWSKMQKSIDVSLSTLMSLKWPGISKHSCLSMWGQAMCQARWNCVQARSQSSRSALFFMSSITLPTLSWPASLRVILPLKRLISKECHSKTPTRQPRAGSTENSGRWSTAISTGNVSCTRCCTPSRACSKSNVTGVRKAHSWGISFSRFSRG
mmetsp:Transcript_30921/g.103014  ORF Transcript_30921/g.103014 Transcript_30921/m.103014 type:complete len:221 (-) Transcript_30921:12827-13489(-)